MMKPVLGHHVELNRRDSDGMGSEADEALFLSSGLSYQNLLIVCNDGVCRD